MTRAWLAVFWAAVSTWSLAGEVEAPVPNAPFRFLGGERVRLIVPKEVGESIEQLVTDDGFISLPGGGAPVSIKGKTVSEAHALISELISKESGAKRASAALAIMEIPARKIYVGGEVKLPQAVILPPEGVLSLGAALAAAGGATQEGDVSKVSVTQRGANGVPETERYDASQVAKGGASVNLAPGAVVIVPRGDVFILAGEVAKPGPFSRKELSLAPGEPAYLTRVLYGGGGPKVTANRKDIRVIRTRKDGTREIIPANLDAAVKAAEAGKNEAKAAQAAATNTSETPEAKQPQQGDVVLQNGDIVLVGAAGGVVVLGRVKLPGVYPLAGDTLRLSRAIALAGGFSDFAKTSAVTVIRAGASKKPIRVDMSTITRDGDVDKDLELEDGDLVFVSERLL